MKVIVDLCIVPVGVGTSLSKYITLCQEILQKEGLSTHLHAYGTNIEGEWETVFKAIQKCHEKLHEVGAPRITTSIRCGTRVDRFQTMEEKVRSVEEKLGNSQS